MSAQYEVAMKQAEGRAIWIFLCVVCGVFFGQVFSGFFLVEGGMASARKTWDEAG